MKHVEYFNLPLIFTTASHDTSRSKVQQKAQRLSHDEQSSHHVDTLSTALQTGVRQSFIKPIIQ